MKKQLLNLILAGGLLLGNVPVYGMENENLDGTYQASYTVQEWESGNQIYYPVTSDDASWKEFQTHDDMIKACNLPNVLMDSSSTDTLVGLMLDYPLLGDLFLYDDIGTGIEVMISESNILSEIINRDDGAEKLLLAYERLDLESNEKSKEIDKNNSMIQDVFLEGILAKEEVFTKLTSEEKSSLNKAVNKNVEIKENSSDYDGYTYVFYNEYENEQTETYGIARDTSATVKTPKGTSVSVIKRTYSATESSEAYNYTVKNYPNATIISGATTNYNCHSYAWYSQSTSNKYWMNNPGAYMSDGSYTQVGTKPSATGQKVCYTQYPLNNPFKLRT